MGTWGWAGGGGGGCCLGGRYVATFEYVEVTCVVWKNVYLSLTKFRDRRYDHNFSHGPSGLRKKR